MADLREKRVELILQQLEDLPTLPAVAVRVLEVTGDEKSSADEVVQLISSDPALTARILQLVRRADLGVRSEIVSIDRAVVMLGFDAVRSAVLAISVFQTFARRQEEEPAASRFAREEFWKHCLAVACCAELLAEAGKRPDVKPSDAFICGLLHDLGKVALDAILPKSYSRVVEAADLLRGNIADVERNVIGLDHLVVGKRLAERWQLPSSIRDCIWLHGQPPASLPQSVRQPRLVHLVTLADAIVREQHLGYSGNYVFPVARTQLLEAAGITAQQAAHAAGRLVERMEPRSAALGLGQETTGQLYQQALAQANRELGTVSAQLASKNQKLSSRAKFFDALSHFQSQLRPDAPPQTVLQAIARTALESIGAPVVGVFSLPPGQDYAECLVHGGNESDTEPFLLDLPGMSAITADAMVAASAGDRTGNGEANASLRAGSPAGVPANKPGDGPVLPAGDSLEWFIESVSPRLPHDKRFWICLEADGACIGGVVWGAPAGEAARLVPQAQELHAIAHGWGLALRAAQIREEARALAENLADANRRLHEAQAEVLRTKSILSVGEMAAGAAHEMNNPLAVISGRSQLLASQLTDPKQKASAQLVADQADRLSGIITDLMHFARPQPPKVREYPVKSIIEQALAQAKALHNSVDREVELAVEVLPEVRVDETQVTSALAEVIDNALLATANPAGHVRIEAAFDAWGGQVVLTVTDDGCGMDEATLTRAFDPFYSHQQAGRRRGLGLAKALRWIEASGGTIRLESRPAEGTRAVILLPAVAVSADAMEQIAARKAAQ